MKDLSRILIQQAMVVLADYRTRANGRFRVVLEKQLYCYTVRRLGSAEKSGDAVIFLLIKGFVSYR
jgi:hypothetical protein